jgi:hypothetical protein
LREQGKRYLSQTGIESQCRELDRRQVEDRGSSDFFLPVDVGVVLVGILRNAAMGFFEELCPSAGHDAFCRTGLRTGGLLPSAYAIETPVAFDHGGNVARPLVSGDIERAGLHTVTASDAAAGVIDHRPLGRLLKCSHGTHAGTGWFLTMHALLADEIVTFFHHDRVVVRGELF